VRAFICFFQLAIALLLANSVTIGQGGGGESIPNVAPNPVVRRHSRPKTNTPSRGAPVEQPTRDPSEETEEAIEGGNTAQSAKNYIVAESQYRRALLINSKESRAYYGLGNVYLAEGRYDDALSFYKSAIQFNPDFVEAHIQIGYIYDAQRRYSEAVAEYEAALAAAPRYTETDSTERTTGAGDQQRASLQSMAHAYLGYTYARMGRRAEAAQQCKEAISLKSNSVLAYLVLAKMRNDEYENEARLFQSMPDGQAKNDQLKKAQTMLDTVIDAYAQAIAVSESNVDFQQVGQKFLQDLESYYRFRHNNSTKGMQELIDKYKAPGRP
jgi:tetratricopeptide (TPR) repeat protein